MSSRYRHKVMVHSVSMSTTGPVRWGTRPRDWVGRSETRVRVGIEVSCWVQEILVSTCATFLTPESICIEADVHPGLGEALLVVLHNERLAAPLRLHAVVTSASQTSFCVQFKALSKDHRTRLDWLLDQGCPEAWAS